MKRYGSILLVIMIIAVSVIGCSQKSASTPVPTDELKTFTLEDLAQYDGQDGRDAYVAVDGIVYDVTNVKQWRDGKHNGYTAGKDLTYEIKNISPHGVSKLRNVPVVGKLEE